MLKIAPAGCSGAARSAVIPAAFVVFWSSGFITAKLGLFYVEPMTFLALRFAMAGVLLLLVALIWHVAWPKSWVEVGHITASGLLIHGVYLGGVLASIDHGVEAGVSSLIVSLQPLVTAALAAWFLGERATWLQWFGLVLGLAGVTLVVLNKLGLGIGTPLGMGLSVLALFGITIGTLYQKQFCTAMNLISGNAIQFMGACAVMTVLAFALESRKVIWSGEFIFALIWSVVVVSLAAITLLYVLIRGGAMARAVSLIYLVPAATALIAWRLFDEAFGPVALAGMAFAMIGVALVNVTTRS